MLSAEESHDRCVGLWFMYPTPPAAQRNQVSFGRRVAIWGPDSRPRPGGPANASASSHLSAPSPAAQTGADLGHGIERAVAPELRDVERPALNLPVRNGARKA